MGRIKNIKKTLYERTCNIVYIQPVVCNDQILHHDNNMNLKYVSSKKKIKKTLFAYHIDIVIIIFNVLPRNTVIAVINLVFGYPLITMGTI